MQSRTLGFIGIISINTYFCVRQENKTAVEDFNMVINRALMSIDWLVWWSHGLKLSECVVVHWDAGSMCTWGRVHALSTSPQFGDVPGTNCNFDGALPGDMQDNQTILVAAMPFLNGCIEVCHFMWSIHDAPLQYLVATGYWSQYSY